MGFFPKLFNKSHRLNEKLIAAVKDSDPDKVKALIAAGADVNASKVEIYRSSEVRKKHYPKGKPLAKPVLHYAFNAILYDLSFDNPNQDKILLIIDMLLDAGANINTRDESMENRTPLMTAAWLNSKHIVKRLIERGADTELRDQQGKTVLQIVLSEDNIRYHDVFNILVRETDDGKNWIQSPEGQEWKEAHKIDANSPIPGKRAEIANVLSRAFKRDNEEQLNQIIQWVETGGDIDWRTQNGWTLLHIAARSGNERMVRFLLEKGAAIDSHDNREATPLIMACAGEMNPEIVKLLLEKGADPNSKDRDGNTALKLIRRYMSSDAQEIGNLLEQHGAHLIPGETVACPECGAPMSVEMKKRAVNVSINGVFAEFNCLVNGESIVIPLDSITKTHGVRVRCPGCRAIAFIPPSVWCKTCGEGLSTGWQSMIRDA